MNNWLTKINSTMSKTMGKVELKLKKKSPEILIGVGITGFFGTVVVACGATLRADQVLEYHRMKMKDINDAKILADSDPENELEYTDSLYKQDIAFQYMKTAGRMLKLYAPAIALGTVSIACILVAKNVMDKRYLGVVAAYNGLSAAFEEYRRRVKEEYGDEMDRHFRYGAGHECIKEVNEDGSVTESWEEHVDTSLISPKDDTCRYFDSSNPNWDQNPNFSMMFLRGQQNYLNDLLHSRGHVFLNEVYDALGFDHTPQGAVIGWLEGAGDDFIDFGLYDQNKDNVRRFVNGKDNVILLEFNHDGVIWDKI